MRVRAPEALTLIIVWPIIAQPPMPPNSRRRCSRRPGRGLRGSCGSGVGDLVDELRGHQRLEQPDERHRERVGGDDRERLEVQRHVRDEQGREAVGQLALVATVGMAIDANTVTRVRTTIATRGAGDRLREAGGSTMIAMPAAAIGRRARRRR